MKKKLKWLKRRFLRGGEIPGKRIKTKPPSPAPIHSILW
jgi:hypothetical protein